mmetsp:Transcript_10631/g.12146  ORF Transcript_10631/g.12146 Transcript_10631/m.12146 type:complete len:688 (+) Transcript_10631:144-2207(+)
MKSFKAKEFLLNGMNISRPIHSSSRNQIPVLKCCRHVVSLHARQRTLCAHSTPTINLFPVYGKGKRCYSVDAGSKRNKSVEIVGRDKAILLLEGKDLDSHGLNPGNLLYAEGIETPNAVMIYSAYGFHFALDLSLSASICQETLDVNNSTILQTRKNAELEIHVQDEIRGSTYSVSEALNMPQSSTSNPRSVFQVQPRDLDRTMIDKCWLTANPAVDMLAPIGQGQSMLIVDGELGRKRGFIYDIAQGIHINRKGEHLQSVFVVEDKTNLEEVLKGDEMLRSSVVVYPDRNSTDLEANKLLATFIGCSLAEMYRDSGRNSLLVLPEFVLFHNVWRRGQRLAAAYVEKQRNTIPEALFSPGADRGDVRKFYSSLVQRAAKLNEKNGNGSMTMLQALGDKSFSIEDTEKVENKVEIDNKEQKEYSLTDFENPLEFGLADLARIQALVDRGISLTLENLEKIGIQQPGYRIANDHTATANSVVLNTDEKKKYWGLVGPLQTVSSLRQHSEELKSLSDGHLCVQRPVSKRLSIDIRDTQEALSHFAIDPRNSLTRIGIGTNINDIRDTRPVALRKAIGGLRLHLIELLDIDPSKGKLPNRAIAWTHFFTEEEGNMASLELEVCVGFSISRGYFDGERELCLLEDGTKSVFASAIVSEISVDMVENIQSGKVKEAELDSFVKFVLEKCVSKI